jgi:GDPmannose 4,6-dehydratase
VSQAAGIDIEFSADGKEEIGTDVSSGKVRVAINAGYYRPAEVELLIGNAAKAHKVLGWKPETTLEQLCSMMVD